MPFIIGLIVVAAIIIYLIRKPYSDDNRIDSDDIEAGDKGSKPEKPKKDWGGGGGG